MTAVQQYMQEKAADEKRSQALERGQNPYAEGTRYYDLYQNNPYAPEKFTRKQTIWDRLANSFGMRSSYDAAQDEWAKAASEYDAQIAQLKGEDEYNSEAAKAQRMRSAGLNPDLQGIGEASEAGEFAQEQTTPDINRNSEDVDRVLSAMQAIPQGITFALSIADKAMGTMKLIYDLKEKKANFGKKLQDMAGSFIDEFMNTELVPDGENKQKIDFANTVQQLEKSAELWAKKQGFTKKEREIFTNNVRALALGGKKEEVYKKYTGMLKARKEFGETYGSQYTPKTDETDEILEIVGTLITKWDSALLHNAEATAKKAENEETFQKNRDPELEALAIEAKNTEAIGHGQLVSSARKSMKTAINKLHQYTGQGNLFAISLESVLAMLQLKYLE